MNEWSEEAVDEEEKRNGNEPRLMMVVLGSEGERNATLR
jgi:hypothetical protein